MRVTAGLAESIGSLPPGLWLTSPAGWLPRTGISSGTLRSAVEYGLPFWLLYLFLPQSAKFRHCRHVCRPLSFQFVNVYTTVIDVYTRARLHARISTAEQHVDGNLPIQRMLIQTAADWICDRIAIVAPISSSIWLILSRCTRGTAAQPVAIDSVHMRVDPFVDWRRKYPIVLARQFFVSTRQHHDTYDIRPI